MVINLSSVKTEALLLFCRDLIEAYENNSSQIYNVDKDTKEFIALNINDLKRAINVVLQKNEYYIKNARVTRIRIILNYYNQINKLITNKLEKNTQFNPSMLCFSLLATWFKELEHQEKSKEFLYFTLYPYGEIFDALIIKKKDKEYKNLNIKMIEISEYAMIILNQKRL